MLKRTELWQPKNESSTLNEVPLILTVSEFNDQFPNIPWFEYIRTLMFPYAVITKSEKILVTCPGYIKSLDSLLLKTPKRVQANYIMWRTIQGLIPYLNEELGDRAFAYESVLYGISEKLPRWKRCIQETYNRLPIPLSASYIQKYFEANTKDTAATLIRAIKEQFRKIIGTSLDISSTSKENILAKFSEMTDFIAYPESIRDVNLVNDMYDKLEVGSDGYLRSYLNINIRNREIFIKSLREPVTPDNLFNIRVLAELHTSYNSIENSLSVSAGTLQGLLFNQNHPVYLNYGAIGFDIAREITKVFNGWQKELLDLETRNCLVNQYNDFTVSTMDESLNGTITLTKNIQDNIGIRIAYLAYQWIQKNNPQQNLAALEYTPNQLFWISFAVSQCSKQNPDFVRTLVDEYESVPPEFRVIGSLANLDDFSNDFGCPASTSMNPINKCLIW